MRAANKRFPQRVCIPPGVKLSKTDGNLLGNIGQTLCFLFHFQDHAHNTHTLAG